jgi:anion-transporting  ArsA/GET3 family ATPase
MEVTPKVIVCAGSGGVGKTTVAAAMGCAFAMSGKKTLVLTIDPAKRLAQALGIGGRLEEDVLVNDPRLNGKLFATMLDAQSVFDKFVRKAAPDSAIAEKLLKNRLYQQLATSLSGSQEFTSLVKVISAVSQYDILILDTPPSQNAVDFLKAPERIFSLFQESVTKWFSRSEEKKGLFSAIISRGTRTVLSALERVTGSQFIGELTDFFQSMSHLQKRVRERSQEVRELLLSPATKFVLVTGFDEVKIREAMDFQEDLTSQGYRLAYMIMNRCFPEWSLKDANWDNVELRRYYDLMRRQFEHRIELADELQKKIPGLPLYKIPEMKSSPQAIDDLIELGQYLKERTEVPK